MSNFFTELLSPKKTPAPHKELTGQEKIRLAQQQGQELEYIRSTEISDELKEKLEIIGQKANDQGEFPDNTLTLQNLFNIIQAITSLIPYKETDEAKLMRSVAKFISTASIETTDDKVNLEAPLKNEKTGYIEIGYHMLSVNYDKKTNMRWLGYQPLFSTVNHPVSQSIAQTVFDKIKATGIPLKRMWV